MIVDIEEVLRISEERRAINRLPFDEIEWHQNGVKIEIAQETLDDFELIGLNNMDFITSHYYLRIKCNHPNAVPCEPNHPIVGKMKVCHDCKTYIID